MAARPVSVVRRLVRAVARRATSSERRYRYPVFLYTVPFMGFSIKLAPGVRIRASKRGICTSLGPRIARVHVGGGRTGLSTGVGPVSFYTSTGGGRRRSSGGGYRPTAASYQRQYAAYTASYARPSAAEEKARQARQLVDAFQAILNVHREEFVPASRPIAPPPPAVPEAEIYQRHEQQALTGVSRFRPKLRQQRREASRNVAAAEIAHKQRQLAEQHAVWQRELDRRWELLLANDPAVVMETIEEAFEDNEVPAAAVGLDGTELALVMLAPDPAIVPDRMPGTTSAGNLSLRKLNKTDAAGYYRILVCGHVLATLREAFAVAPAVTAARIVVVRRAAEPASDGRECLLAARVTAAAMARVDWREAGAGQVLTEVSEELVANLRGRTREFGPVDLQDEPELKAILDAIDLDELT
jgi:hypothetical protein